MRILKFKSQLTIVFFAFDITNLYITKSSVQQTIFFAPVIVKYMEKNLNLTKRRYGKHILPVPWPSLYRGSTAFQQYVQIKNGL